jgi:hypothetical protein
MSILTIVAIFIAAIIYAAVRDNAGKVNMEISYEET